MKFNLSKLREQLNLKETIEELVGLIEIRKEKILYAPKPADHIWPENNLFETRRTKRRRRQQERVIDSFTMYTKISNRSDFDFGFLANQPSQTGYFFPLLMKSSAEAITMDYSKSSDWEKFISYNLECAELLTAALVDVLDKVDL